MNYFLRRIALKISNTFQLIKNDDGSFTISTKSKFKNIDFKFFPNIETEEMTPDGRKVRFVISFEENKIIQQQVGDEENLVRIEREFYHDQMIVKIFYKSIVAKRWFKVVNE